MKDRRNAGRKADIDITPLIDMMFMLIIFFVLTTSFVNSKINVELPAEKGSNTTGQTAVIVSVQKDGSIHWDGENITLAELSEYAKSMKGKEIFVAGDKGADYGKVVEVLSVLKEEGIPTAGLLTQSEK